MVLILIHNSMLHWLLHVFLIPHVKPSFDRILLWIVWSIGRVHTKLIACPSEGGFEWFGRTPPNSDLARCVELFKSFQPEVQASKSVKRFKSYGHLKFLVHAWINTLLSRGEMGGSTNLIWGGDSYEILLFYFLQVYFNISAILCSSQLPLCLSSFVWILHSSTHFALEHWRNKKIKIKNKKRNNQGENL